MAVTVSESHPINNCGGTNLGWTVRALNTFRSSNLQSCSAYAICAK